MSSVPPAAFANMWSTVSTPRCGYAKCSVISKPQYRQVKLSRSNTRRFFVRRTTTAYSLPRNCCRRRLALPFQCATRHITLRLHLSPPCNIRALLPPIFVRAIFEIRAHHDALTPSCMSAVPRVAHASLTSKQPDACPHCGSHNVRRRGVRKKKLEIVQLWRCGSCKRTFTPGPAALHNKTYPLRMILGALTDYNLGYSLEQTATRLKKKTHRNVSPSTISAWLDAYKQHTSYRRLRATGLRFFPPQETIRSIKLYHRQIYGFSYHRSKLELLRRGELDDKRAGSMGSTARSLADSLASTSVTHEKRMLRPRRQRSSFLPSATTSSVTRRCSISCSPTTA